MLKRDLDHGNRGGGPLHQTATTDLAGFMSAEDKTLVESLKTEIELTGSIASGEAFTNLVAALIAMGLNITDSTTA